MMEDISMMCFGERMKSFCNAQKANHLRLSWKKSAKELLRDINLQHPVAVGIGIRKPAPNIQIAFDILKHTKGNIPIFLIVDSSITENIEFARLVSNANIDYALEQSKSSEVAQRLKVLLHAHGIEDRKNFDRLPGFSNITKKLYDKKSYRLNAIKIADLFGISVRQLSSIIGALPQSVHKTPDAERLQNKLAVFEHIGRGLALVNMNGECFRRWLNATNRELDNYTPLQIIKDGKGEIVANLVEDTLLGQPS